jgi:hypothetical protein
MVLKCLGTVRSIVVIGGVAYFYLYYHGVENTSAHQNITRDIKGPYDQEYQITFVLLINKAMTT